ncbi:unnamed protein product, partial [Scytosiphon promiscuus]
EGGSSNKVNRCGRGGAGWGGKLNRSCSLPRGLRRPTVFGPTPKSVCVVLVSDVLHTLPDSRWDVRHGARKGECGSRGGIQVPGGFRLSWARKSTRRAWLLLRQRPSSLAPVLLLLLLLLLMMMLLLC